ncbi:hypothetical protein [Methylobacterium sp. Leaf117]|uniref:hypothetical protein n=1 Tax=Methylobacterium sp. Leaf117 TaxID=1736260 RepID=UPI00072B4AA2|nr:hypothetical protein [Methylobacterium sp. Leaf117]KQP77451.1 hypothetical protein ASF57_19275 [Methylobacterium sp. Leaf117]
MSEWVRFEGIGLPAHGVAPFDQSHDGVHRLLETHSGHRCYAVQSWAKRLKEQFLLERIFNENFLDFMPDRVKKLDTKAMSFMTSDAASPGQPASANRQIEVRGNALLSMRSHERA